jgi:hypothetical protein
MSEETRPGAAGVIVLTDIVEEGLPLDQLPEISGGLQAESDRNRFDKAPEPESPEPEFQEPESREVDLEVLELDLEASLMQDAVAGSEEEPSPAATAGDREKTAGEKPPAEAKADAKADEIAGDVDALLDDDEFAELEFPENSDPVLAGLRHAGLRRAGEEPEPVAGRPVSGPDCESPDDYLVDEEPEPAGAGPAAAGTQTEAEISSSLAATIRRQVEAAAPQTASSEPEICTEPTTPDFSRQIESLTQEWSKQLLQSTYASMDKMIQAVGDLAPTIVDRVAREIIPPLAEQVIKAEIARLEAKLESEEEPEDEIPPPPPGPKPAADE